MGVEQIFFLNRASLVGTISSRAFQIKLFTFPTTGRAQTLLQIRFICSQLLLSFQKSHFSEAKELFRTPISWNKYHQVYNAKSVYHAYPTSGVGNIALDDFIHAEVFVLWVKLFLGTECYLGCSFTPFWHHSRSSQTRFLHLRLLVSNIWYYTVRKWLLFTYYWKYSFCPV